MVEVSSAWLHWPRVAPSTPFSLFPGASTHRRTGFACATGVLVGLLVTLACVHAAFRTAAPLTVTFSNDTRDEILVNDCVVNSPLFVEPRSTAVLVLGEERPLVCALQVSTRGGLFGTIRCLDVPFAHRGHAHLAATAAERVRRGSPCSP